MVSQKIYFEAIGRALGLPDDFKLSPETEISNIPGWDSLGWVTVILALEELSGKDFPIEDIENVKTLEELLKHFKSASIEDNE